MRDHRLPRSYWAIVVLSLAAPPLIMVVNGDPIHPRVGGLVLVALILWALARGSLLAWGLSLLWNLFLGFAIAVSAGGGIELSGVFLVATAVASLWALLSPSMRMLVGLRRRAAVSGPSVG